MKNLYVILIVLASCLLSQATLAESYTLKKAVYLAMNNYDKLQVLALHFGIASKNTRGLIYENLEVTPPFRLTVSPNVSDKNYAAALKVLRQFELDTRENGRALVASVLFENATRSITGEDNPWAVLLSRARITPSGQMKLDPLIIYSVEGAKMLKISNQFDGPLL